MIRVMTAVIALAALALPTVTHANDMDTRFPDLPAEVMIIEDHAEGRTVVRPMARPNGHSGPPATPQPLSRPESIAVKAELAAMPLTLEGASDLTCMAVAIYHEARGEPLEGQQAVASVIMQRAAVPHRWGEAVCDVVVPVQFSFLDKDLGFAPIHEVDAWMAAVDVAAAALAAGPDPSLSAADHYHRVDVRPSWRHHMDVVAIIHNHVFYADPDSCLNS